MDAVDGIVDDDELEGGGVVEIDEEGEALVFGPCFELGCGDGGESGEAGIERGRGGFEGGVIDEAVFDVGFKQSVIFSVGVVVGPGVGGEA